MKKVNLEKLMAANAQVLKKEDLKFILGAGEGYDSLDGSEPNCLGVQCINDDQCKDPFCPRCDLDPSGPGLCAT